MESVEEIEFSLALENKCSEGNWWIWRYFGECVHAPHQVAGFCCGVISILVWLIAHIVLLTLRHRQHAIPPFPKKGLSFMQLSFKTVSDVFQCAGAILTRQFGTQIAMGLYLIVANCVMYIQWLVLHMVQIFFCPCTTDPYIRLLLCSLKKKKKRQRLSTSMFVLPLALCTAGTIYSLPRVLSRTEVTDPFLSPCRKTSRVLLGVPVEWDHRYNGGYWLGILSCVMDVLYALPPAHSVILQNVFSRLHIAYIALACVGDILYILAVYTQEASTALFIHSLPWILPRTIVIGVNFGILIQSYWNSRLTSTHNVLNAEAETLLCKKELLDGWSEEWRKEKEEEEGAGAWVPLKDMRNTYLRKMSIILQELQSSSEDDESESDDAFEYRLTRQASDFPAVELKSTKAHDLPDAKSKKSMFEHHNLDEDEIEESLSCSPIDLHFQLKKTVSFSPDVSLDEAEIEQLLRDEEKLNAQNYSTNKVDDNGFVEVDLTIPRQDEEKVIWFEETETEPISENRKPHVHWFDEPATSCERTESASQSPPGSNLPSDTESTLEGN